MDKQPLAHSTRQWLLDQIELWQGKGLVSEDQANAILDLYETPTQSSARHQSVAIYVLVGIAALFVALAAFLILGVSWEFLPDPLKCMVLLGLVVGSHGLGFYLRYQWQAKIFSEFAFFFGSLLYGAAMMLIAHIFHLGEHPPDGMWWWALGVMPLALFLDTVLLHLLVTALLAVWVGWELIGSGHHEFELFGMLPRAAFTLPIFAGLGLAWGYLKKSPTTVGLYVPLVAWWIVLLPLAWKGHENPTLFIGSAGALLLILAEVHPDGSRFAIPYRLYGALLCMGVLSMLSFHWIHRDLARIQDVWPFVVQSLLIAGLSGLVFGIAFVVQTQREGARYERPLVAFAVRQWLPLSMAVLMLVLALYYVVLKDLADQHDLMIALLPTVLANVGMLGLAFWLMMYGLREDRGFPAAGGVGFFLLWSIIRYAEWFGNRGELLGAACMFFLCGAAIFGFAMFWHMRKKQRERERDERELE